MRKLKRTFKKAMKFIFSFQFSKLLMLLETGIVLYLVIKCIELAFMCVENQFSGGLPWVTTMITSAFAAYMASAAFYYNKGKAEQVAKIEKFGIESSILNEIPIPDIDVSVEERPTI